MSKNEALNTLTENLCMMCAYMLSNNMDTCNISYCDNKDAIETITELLEQTEWIPVSERLPEVGHRVIFNMNNDEIYIGTLYKWDNDLKISLEPTGIGYVYSFENVTAWMPLPEPYKAGE